MRIFAILTVVLLYHGHSIASDITIRISGINVNQGRIFIGIFDNPDEFPNGREKAGQFVDSDTEKIRVIFTDVADGEYAFAVFQDKNSNEKLDTNFLGIPNEPYGFSGKQVFGQPDFEDAAVHIDSEISEIEIDIK